MQAGRRKILRNIAKDHSHVCFKPCGVRAKFLEKMVLDADEMEALRLSDFEGYYQEECAKKMAVSRTTFSRLINNAHKKIADALLHGKAIVMTQNQSKENNENSDSSKNE
ncbi:MAG: DUF134 domain-containing protein [Sulfurovum sp.]|nr:DUF134 domain-containing protein [Sulfurovum sp.]